MFLEHRHEVSVLTQGVHHRLYRVSHSGEKNLFTGLFIGEPRRFLPMVWIAVQKGEQRDLFPKGLKVRGNRVSDQTTKRPAEQMVWSDGLNLANKAQIIYDHFLNSTRKDCWLTKVACLETVDRVVRWDVSDQP